MVTVASLIESTISTGQSRSAYGAMLKQVYGPAWSKWLHTDSGKISEKIAKKKGSMGGQMKVNAITTALPQSAGMSLGEGSLLPMPVHGSYINPRIIARDFYTRLRWTGQSQRAARMGDKAAWARPKQNDVEDARAQSGLNFARKLYLGYYDILEVVETYNHGSTINDGTVLELYDRDTRRSGHTEGGGVVSDYHKFGGHYLREGMVLQSVLKASGLAGSADTEATSNALGFKIDSIDLSDLANPSITVKLAEGSTDTTAVLPDSANELLIPFGSRRDSVTTGDTLDSDFYTFNGVQAVLQGSDFYSHLYGLAKATYSKLSGVIDRSTAANTDVRAYSELRSALMFDRIRNEGSGGKPDCIIVQDALLRGIVDATEDKRRFAPVQKGEFGYGALQFTAGDTTTPIIADWLQVPGQMLFLDSKQWGFYTESELSPLDDPQTRFVTDKDQTEITFHMSGNVECMKPHSQGVIDDLGFSAGDTIGTRSV